MTCVSVISLTGWLMLPDHVVLSETINTFKGIGIPVEKNYTISRPIFSSTINSFAYCISTR